MVTVALVFDTVYPLFVLRVFHVLQALILVVVLAIGPYALVRGIITRLTRGSRHNGRYGRPSVVLSG